MKIVISNFLISLESEKLKKKIQKVFLCKYGLRLLLPLTRLTLANCNSNIEIGSNACLVTLGLQLAKAHYTYSK